ncbi:hypothetical protein OG470_31265 [Micromonospora sp. NBC_00389]|uniref:hypothetical protein n=1 Tax=Micromonospora sp. NBC_00389 TaxID=2903586 RepID=UPI002E210BD5
MSTYRELFRTPEFTPMFASASATIAARTVSGLALGTLVYGATGSPLLSALSTFGSSFAQMIGIFTVLSAADRLPPRAATAGIAVLFAAGTAVLAVPGLPAWGMVLVVLGIGLVNSVAGGVRWGLLHEILPAERYLLGRSVFNMAVGVMQIAGFAAGGLLLVVLSPRQGAGRRRAQSPRRSGGPARAHRPPAARRRPPVDPQDLAGQRPTVGVASTPRHVPRDVVAQRLHRGLRSAVRPVRARFGQCAVRRYRVRDVDR